jgi:hypothetical protein
MEPERAVESNEATVATTASRVCVTTGTVAAR